jgi:hypothetical protein
MPENSTIILYSLLPSTIALLDVDNISSTSSESPLLFKPESTVPSTTPNALKALGRRPPPSEPSSEPPPKKKRLIRAESI